MAFSYYSAETINSGQVPGAPHTDFPRLINITDNRFKTIGNGGHVANSSGFDIRPYSDSGLTSALTFELERYNGTTGEVVMWVKIGSMSDGDIIYIAYGNGALNTNGSNAATWSNSFLAVYHFKDGTTLSLTDSLAAFNLNGINTPTAVAGQIDGGIGLASASSQRAETSSNGPADVAITISAWAKGTTFPSDFNFITSRGASSVDQYGLAIKSDGKLFCQVRCTGGNVLYNGGSHTLATGTWYYIVLTYDSSGGLKGYFNASSDGLTAANGTANTGGVAMSVGSQRSTSSRYFNGSLDEIRFANVARNANWITAEYRNQSAPQTFATLDTEVSLASATRRQFFVGGQ